MQISKSLFRAALGVCVASLAVAAQANGYAGGQSTATFSVMAGVGVTHSSYEQTLFNSYYNYGHTSTMVYDGSKAKDTITAGNSLISYTDAAASCGVKRADYDSEIFSFTNNSRFPQPVTVSYNWVAHLAAIADFWDPAFDYATAYGYVGGWDSIYNQFKNFQVAGVGSNTVGGRSVHDYSYNGKYNLTIPAHQTVTVILQVATGATASSIPPN